ncbi:MAG: hypothetical protein QM529_06370 [Hydrotalea sp.]|nr:hypothetical protein [Hydrotalea sp.]
MIKTKYRGKEAFKPFVGIDQWLLIFLVILFSLIFFSNAGTHDVDDRTRWLEMVGQLGFGEGFKKATELSEVPNVYPPLTITILQFFYKIIAFFNSNQVDSFFANKLSIFVLYVVSFFTFLFCFANSNRNFTIGIIFFIGLICNATIFGYGDIYFAPFLFFAFWGLKHQRYVLFSVMFAIACLIKYQPLVLGPFIFIYILHQSINQSINQSSHCQVNLLKA